MTSRIRRDPARREQLLERLRAVPRSTLTELVDVMKLSRACTRAMLSDAEVAGLVASALCVAAKPTARSQVPKVYWLTPAHCPISTPVVRRRTLIVPVFPTRALHPPEYGPTGTPADRQVWQVFRVAGWV